MSRPVPRPNELEAMANLLLGPDQDAEPLPPPQPRGLRGALEAVLIRALSRPPCLVSFSGGRDSSAVLALATDCARRHGLGMPVPAIMRFPRAPAADEARWQEAVLAHLDLPGAEIVELGAELDALGPMATDVLQHHGLLWPGNAYMHLPVIDLARGGTVLTGVGGDELLSTRAPRRSPRQLAVAAMPSRVRERVWRSRQRPGSYAWLTEEGRERVHRALAREEIRCPYPWDAALTHWYASRAFAASDGALTVVAADRDVRVINPFLDPQVLSELHAAGGRRGFPDRTQAMRELCGDLLPPETLARPTKATFGGAIWGPAVREFAHGWRGGGLDRRYVSPDRLRAELLSDEPDFRCVLLLHQAWLYERGCFGRL